MLSALTSNFPLLNEYEKEAENLEWKARVKNSSNISMRIIFPPVSISTCGRDIAFNSCYALLLRIRALRESFSAEKLSITMLYTSKNSELDLAYKRLKIPRIS